MLSSVAFNLIMLMFFPPIGVITMWIFTDWDTPIKMAITLLIISLVFIKKKNNDVFTILMLIFFPIVGIFSMWILTKWHFLIKIIITVLMSAYVLVIYNYIIDLFV